MVRHSFQWPVYLMAWEQPSGSTVAATREKTAALIEWRQRPFFPHWQLGNFQLHRTGAMRSIAWMPEQQQEGFSRSTDWMHYYLASSPPTAADDPETASPTVLTLYEGDP